ncbi:MAG: alpha/beta hydrolase [Gluconacetobacter diazotrophicus]|nr:alpha/beta hydrolase [Gluconacetobacter diazotrophicus]
MRRPDLPSRLVLRMLPPFAEADSVDMAAARAATDRAPLPLAWMRRGLRAVREGEVPGAEAALRARLYVPRRARGLVLFLHGGGFALCGLDSHDGICAALARRSGASVLSVGYRLAPDHPFPAAPEDAFAAYRWLRDQAGRLGGGTERIVVAGDSAGGNLAAVLCLMARDRGVEPPVLQVLFYPPTTGREDVPSRTLFADGYWLSTAMMEWFERLYLGGRVDEASPYYMPARAADLSRLPPALIVGAAFDPLRDEGRVYAARLRAAGVAVRHREFPGTIHGFLNFHPFMPKAWLALREAGTAMRAALDGV